MAASALIDDSEVQGLRYWIVGCYAEPVGDRVVQHVALLSADQPLRLGVPVNVHHMGPPLVAGAHSAARFSAKQRQCCVNMYGSIHLAPGEPESIETWLAEVEKEDRPAFCQAKFWEHYVAHPAVEWVRDLQTNVRRYRRFSCVGFVTECYREAVGVELLTRSHDRLPSIRLDVLGQVYPIVHRDRLRERVGLQGNGPYRIAMAGYVFHSLARAEEDVRRVPYVPSSDADIRFP